MSTDNGTSRDAILMAATRLFAEKGYNGASVDAIATEAGVNKALIYYYFSGKREILETLIREAIDSVVKLRDRFFPESPSDVANRSQIRLAMDILESKADVFRVMIVEALKNEDGGDEDGAVFEFLDAVSRDSMERLTVQGMVVKDQQVLDLVGNFYFFIPMSMFMTLGERWSEHYGYDHERSQEVFSDFMGQLLESYLPEIVDGPGDVQSQPSGG